VDTAVVTGSFALGGVALGGVLEWLRAGAASHRAAAAERDEQMAALGTTCTQLLLEIRILRQLLMPRLIPGSMAEQTRARLLPVLGEVTVLSTRLSMQGDAPLRKASQRVVGAAGSLLEHAFDKGGLDEHEEEMKAALKQLRDARDLAAAPRRRWRERRRLRVEAPEHAAEDSGRG